MGTGAKWHGYRDESLSSKPWIPITKADLATAVTTFKVEWDQ